MSVAKLFAALLGLAALALAAPAQATWYKAETDRFIVYGVSGEASVREYAEKLQTFDAILRLHHPSTASRVPNTKVQLYLVRTRDGLRQVKPGLPSDIAGWYEATNEGVFAMGVTDGGLGQDDVLFHEYAHHFMLENFPAAYPAWFVEGFAEYFMTTDIKRSKIVVGGYNPGRAYGVFNVPWVPMEDLLTKSTGQLSASRREAFYAQSWLLMHYMRSDATRAKQLNEMVAAVSKGTDPVTAMKTATGQDLVQLTAALRKYNKLPTLILSGPITNPPQVTAVRLPPSHDDLMLDNLRLLMASTGETDEAFLAGVRRKAARYPGDRFAETTLARAEFVMGDVGKGEATLDRLLKAEPENEELLLQAGTGKLIAGIRDRSKREAHYRAARAPLIKAYKLDAKDFRPLYAYVMSRSIEPAFPNDNDLNAMLEARALAPAVQELSLRAGVAMLARGKKEEAVRLLTPLINNPHGGPAAAQARALLEGKSERQAEAEGKAAEETPIAPQAPPEPAKPAAPKKS